MLTFFFRMFVPFCLVFKFYPPRCYQRFVGLESSVLPVNLPPSVPPRFGVSSSIRFSVVYGNTNDKTGGLSRVRRTTSPYSVRLHVGSVLRISGLALSRLLDLIPNTIQPVRCSLRTQVLPHASFRHAISGYALALLASSFRPVTADPMFQASPETAACASCQAYVKLPPAKPGAY